MAWKFSQELKDRAVRLVFEHQEVHECSRWAAAQAIAVKLGVSPYSVLDQMKKDVASAKAGQGSVIDYAAENARLRAENLELRRVNELLKEASLESNRQGNSWACASLGGGR